MVSLVFDGFDVMHSGLVSNSSCVFYQFFILMDKVIAHELTHTDETSLPGRFATIDVGDEPYGKNYILSTVLNLLR
jgi:hypothetical protein